MFTRRSRSGAERLSRSPSAITTGPLQLGEAAQAWSATKDTTSRAVLGAFVAGYDGTVFAELARARLKELEQEAPSASANPTSPPRPTKEHPFDGIWMGTYTGGEACPGSGTWKMVIQKSVMQGLGRSVNAMGELTFDYPTRVDPTLKNRNTIKLSGNSGTGTYRTLGGTCTGTQVLRRSTGPAVAVPAK